VSFDGFKPLLVPRLGGLVTYVKPVDVPAGFSPALQNVRLRPRAVETRPGLTARISKANATFFGLAQFIDNLGNKTLFTLDNAGNLDRDNGAGGTTSVDPAVMSAGARLETQPAFSREFFAGFIDTATTKAAPAGLVRFSNAQFDPVFPPATPGGGTSAADAGGAATIAAAPNGAVEDATGTISTFTTTGVHGFAVGENVAVTGVTNTAFNSPAGGFTITGVPSSTTFTVNNAAPAANATSGSGTATPGAGSNWGNPTWGAVVFETQSGALSQAGPVFSFAPSGTKQVIFSGIPTGPSYVVARWIILSSNAVSGPFYREPIFRVPDNLTTSFAIASPGLMTVIGADVTSLLTAAWLPPLTHLSVDGPGAAPTAADSANAGSISPGAHQVQVVFETRLGYLSFPSAAATWTAAGSKKVVVSNIPYGPWYVAARRLLFTVSAGADFFYTTAFRIADNTTTSVEVDFSDTSLLQGTNFNYLTRNFMTPEMSAVGQYNGRLTAWGGLNTLKGTNFGFDGGWDTTNSTVAAPLGWIADAVLGPGGSKEVLNAFAGEAWRITGNGATATRGDIRNSSVRSLVALGTTYTISARVARSSGLVSGTLHVNLYSATGINTGLVVPFSSAGTAYAIFTAQTAALSSIPVDLVLRVYADGTPNQNGYFVVDQVEIYPTNASYEASVLRVSNPFDPETFDSINGIVQVSKDDGQRIMDCVQLRSFYYIFKERSMHVTVDDGVNPPSLWLTRQIDSTVGAASPNAVVNTESFVAVASRGGAYVFMGGRPIKVSQEIQTSWEQIDWNQSSAIHTLIDPQRKRIFFYVPFTGDAGALHCLILDYAEGMGDEDNPAGRKWGLDVYPAAVNGSLRYEQTTNTQTLYLAGAKIYEHVGTDDDGAAIDSFYQTAYFKAGDRGQDLYGGVALTVEGAGTMTTTLRGLDDVLVQTLAPITLITSPGKQYELYGNLESERARLQVESNALGANFVLKGAVIYGMPWSEARPL
jgi:hypothetical protein